MIKVSHNIFKATHKKSALNTFEIASQNFLSFYLQRDEGAPLTPRPLPRAIAPNPAHYNTRYNLKYLLNNQIMMIYKGFVLLKSSQIKMSSNLSSFKSLEKYFIC